MGGPVTPEEAHEIALDPTWECLGHTSAGEPHNTVNEDLTRLDLHLAAVSFAPNEYIIAFALEGRTQIRTQCRGAQLLHQPRCTARRKASCFPRS